MLLQTLVSRFKSNSSDDTQRKRIANYQDGNEDIVDLDDDENNNGQDDDMLVFTDDKESDFFLFVKEVTAFQLP